MKIRNDLEIDDEKLAAICEQYHVTELSLFGSVLGDDFGPESDVDVLVAIPYPSPIGLLEFIACAHELEELFGRKVDLMERDGIHWLIRERVRAEARIVYAPAA